LKDFTETEMFIPKVLLFSRFKASFQSLFFAVVHTCEIEYSNILLLHVTFI